MSVCLVQDAKGAVEGLQRELDQARLRASQQDAALEDALEVTKVIKYSTKITALLSPVTEGHHAFFTRSSTERRREDG